MTIVINTPAGNTGRVVSDQLLQAKEQLVIISRHPQKVTDLVECGARLIEGSIDDPLVLDRALQGADALFWVNPAHHPQADHAAWSARTAQLAADALKRNGVKRVVVISSYGAQHGPGAGPVGALLAVETAFQAAAPNVTVMRPALFMEDFVSIPSAFNNIGALAAGFLFGPLPATKKIAPVAAGDVGMKAAEILRSTRWGGFRIMGVHGPEDLDLVRVAQIIGEGIGHPVRYVEVTVAQVKREMLDAGIPSDVVEYIGELYTEEVAGRADHIEPRSPETTTKTSLLEFSRNVIKPAVEAALRPERQTQIQIQEK